MLSLLLLIFCFFQSHKYAAEAAAIQIGRSEEAESRGGQDLRAQEQEQEQECPEIRPKSQTIGPAQTRSRQSRP